MIYNVFFSFGTIFGLLPRLFRWQGDNRSDAQWHREDLQRSQVKKDAVYTSDLHWRWVYTRQANEINVGWAHFLCPRAWLMNQILTIKRGLLTTAWAQKTCPPYKIMLSLTHMLFSPLPQAR